MKRLLLPALGFLLFAQPASAIVDTNNNGMSDVWERHYNAEELFTNLDPQTDPDGDGYTNHDESLAGTDPNNGTPPDGFLIARITHAPAVYSTPEGGGDPLLVTSEGFLVAFQSLVGKQYTIIYSPDLTAGSWSPAQDPVIGTGDELQLPASATYADDGTMVPASFWRVAVTDIDTDGDMLTDYEEGILGTSPANTDTDGDGFADNLDPLPLASATLADPDGSNPPAGSTTNLRGFWDFESQQGTTYPAIFPDRSGANRHATSSGPGPQSFGMPSLAGRIGPGHITIPDSTVEGQAAYTVSGWFKLGKDSITTSNGIYRIIYALYDQEGTGPAPQHAPLAQGTILALRRLSSTTEQWYIGGYHQTTTSNGNPTTSLNGHSYTRPAGTSDDGRWHHFTATRSTAANGQKLYLDGQMVIQGNLLEYPVSFDADTTFSFGILYPGHTPTNLPDAHIDRLRVYSRILSQADVANLYHQDIDRDGLWDITETSTLLWRDLNSDGQATANEQQFSVSPFIAQPTGSDSDDDGLSDLIEQNIGTVISNPDSDGDLMPDGWEYDYSSMAPPPPSLMELASVEIQSTTLPYLDPKVNDANLDADGDGLSNLDEYRNGSDPRKSDTDSDGTYDPAEVTQGSNPNDPSDGGAPIPAAERVSILLGIGDQSGSESEDYVLHCFHIDSQTGQEQRMYTLRSGGFGQYKEETKSFFKKGETYTFQIDWQSSSLSVKAATTGNPSEGPDYDYTFKVQPQGNHGGTLIDSWDKSAAASSISILATDASNVAGTEAEFKQNFENKRVALVNLKVDWESIYQDAALDSHVDPWTNQQNGKRWFPDSPNPKNPEYRDIVGVKVTGGLPNMKFWLRSFDVDDTTLESFDTDSFSTGAVIDTNGSDGMDNRTTGSRVVGVGKQGIFMGAGATPYGRYAGNLNQTGSAQARFMVGTSPGNNYRIAATIKNKDALEPLHTTVNQGDSGTLVSTDSSLSPIFDGHLSPLLTIWRRLWLEIDSMEGSMAPPSGQENWENVNVSSVSSGTALPDGTPLYDCVLSAPFSRSRDEFENGWLIANNNGAAVAVHDVVQWGNGDYVVRTKSDPGQTGGFRLRDDDETALPSAYNPVLPRDSIDMPYAVSKFKSSFIELVSAGTYNSQKTISFKLNEPSMASQVLPVVWNDASNLTDTKSSWVAHAIFGFQDSASKDGDPNSENGNTDSGQTPFFAYLAQTQYSVIWLEHIRETYADPWLISTNPDYVATGAILMNTEVNLTLIHEIGHQPCVLEESPPPPFTSEAHHHEGGIMQDGGSNGSDNNFKPATIARFRRTLQWTQGQRE